MMSMANDADKNANRCKNCPYCANPSFFHPMTNTTNSKCIYPTIIEINLIDISIECRICHSSNVHSFLINLSKICPKI